MIDVGRDDDDDDIDDDDNDNHTGCNKYKLIALIKGAFRLQDFGPLGKSAHEGERNNLTGSNMLHEFAIYVKTGLFFIWQGI